MPRPHPTGIRPARPGDDEHPRRGERRHRGGSASATGAGRARSGRPRSTRGRSSSGTVTGTSCATRTRPTPSAPTGSTGSARSGCTERVLRAAADLDPVASLEENLGAGWEFATRVVFDAAYEEVAHWVAPPMGRLDRLGEGRCELVGTTSNPMMYVQEWLAAMPFRSTSRRARSCGGPPSSCSPGSVRPWNELAAPRLR